MVLKLFQAKQIVFNDEMWILGKFNYIINVNVNKITESSLYKYLQCFDVRYKCATFECT